MGGESEYKNFIEVERSHCDTHKENTDCIKEISKRLNQAENAASAQNAIATSSFKSIFKTLEKIDEKLDDIAIKFEDKVERMHKEHILEIKEQESKVEKWKSEVEARQMKVISWVIGVAGTIILLLLSFFIRWIERLAVLIGGQ